VSNLISVEFSAAAPVIDGVAAVEADDSTSPPPATIEADSDVMQLKESGIVSKGSDYLKGKKAYATKKKLT
jgi:hypothetical protein